MKLVNRNAKANLILSRFVFCAMIVFLYSCGSGGGGDNSSETGSISFGLALQNQDTVSQAVQALNSRAAQALNSRAAVNSEGQFECQTDTYQITSIEAEVVDENDEFLAEGGPWDCDDHQATIGDVKAGEGRIVKVFAIDESGKVVAEGKSDPVTVIAGQTVNTGTIILELVNSAPVADAGPDQMPFVGDTVILDGSASSDVDGDLLSYFWSFTSLPEGSEASLSDPTAINPTFDVDVSGNYVAQLIVNDGTVGSNPDTVAINPERPDFPNNPPEFLPIAPFRIDIGQEIQFDVTADDPDPADILTITEDLSDLPAGATFIQNRARAGTFRWTPGVDDFPRKVSSLTFLFGEFGGNLTIEINGDFQVFQNFSDINNSIIGGASVSVTNGFGQDNGSVSISGAIIETFAIGGQELWVDDFCYPTGCVDFEDLIVGTIYPGNSSFVDSGANIFVNMDFESSSGTAIVENLGMAGGTGNEMRCDNINLDFLFGYTVLFTVTDNGQPPLSDAMETSFTWEPQEF